VVSKELPRPSDDAPRPSSDVEAFKALMKATDEGKYDGEDIDDEVFIQTWIPSNLNQVNDTRYLERELEKKRRGEKVLYERLFADGPEDAENDEEQEEEDEEAEEETEKKVEKPRQRGPADKDNGDKDGTDDEEDAEDEDDEDDEEDGEVNDGHKPEGMDKAAWKQKVKEEKREKRKEKVPKALKKKFRKQAAKGR